ncbi:sensor domain-containing diguanylate cyclase [Paenibacillus sp. 1001270B_150601_E10]|uniref:GGDEF domain-containing protein n=1 Tax=Paenibacillus sp. 1001270B_150601_E10 TaxID=2787079 RepID=UPI00189CA63E|nr:GGDEF domain-containing protein [Paenibacillus sp. 1001270B_150601_E10]
MNEFLMFIPDSYEVAAFSVYCLIYLMVIMIILSIRVFTRQRSFAYILFSIGLALVLIDRIVMLSDLSNTLAPHHWFGISRASMLALSYILLNLAVLRLYKRMNRRARNRFAVLIGGIPVIAIICFAWVQEDQSMHSLYWPIILYQMVAAILCYMWIAPRINQKIHYILSLLTYNIYLLIVMMDAYIYDESNPFLLSAKHLVALLFYSILFLIFFERIIENLQSTYRTSITDGLTGLYNKRYMYQRMNQWFNHRNRFGALIFCDLDNFKKLNDTEGHLYADEVLKQTAQIIREEVDEYGIAGRFGGEELIAFITNKHVSPIDLAETIRVRIEQETGVTGSFGISIHKNHVSVDEFVQQADEAMYSSKQRGKNRITTFDQLQSNNFSKRSS